MIARVIETTEREPLTELGPGEMLTALSIMVRSLGGHISIPAAITPAPGGAADAAGEGRLL